MKLILSSILAFVFISLTAQENNINSTNYYEFLNPEQLSPITTNWLRRTEVVPIIKSELEKYGVENNRVFDLYELSGKQVISLEVYNAKYNFGFIYSTGHSANPLKKHRMEVVDHQIGYYDYQGDFTGYKKVELPSNIYILKENCYWYQYVNDKFEDNSFVDRKVIENVLREDIRKVLSKYIDLEEALEANKWKQIKPNTQFSGFMFVDNWAKFIDGEFGLRTYISKNLNYPEKARKKKIEEEIILEYEILTDGKVGEIVVIKGNSEILINEAKRVIQNMPTWKPAKQKGKAIPMRYTQKFNFKL